MGIGETKRADDVGAVRRKVGATQVALLTMARQNTRRDLERAGGVRETEAERQTDMNHDEQLATLAAIVKRLVRETAAMQDRLAKLEKADADTLTGSIDGLDDVALRVQILSPGELARAKLQRAGKATRTPEPEWSGCSGVD